MKRISNLHLFPRAARTLLTVLMLTLTALAEGAQDPTAKFPTTSGGAGTAESPYLITTIDDLNTLSDDVNRGIDYHGMYFKLESDLDYSGVTVDGGSNFTPIGWASDFYGNFDGGNHTISGVKVEDNTHISCGLFGYVTNGTIKNLKVTNSSFSNSDTNAKVGGIVGYADNSTVENCHTTSDVRVTGYATGGIVGHVRNSAKVIACTSAAAVKGAYVGGILGNYDQSGGSDFELKYCFYYGSSVTQPSNVGDDSGYGALYGRSGTDPEYCYYQSSVKGAHLGKDIGTSQHGYTITLEDGIAMSGYATEPLRAITLPSGDILKIYNDGYSYLGQRYFRYGATVTLSDDQTVDDGYTPGGYTNTDGEMGPVVDGSGVQKNYSSVLSGNTLTMGTCDVTISIASKTPITYNITYELDGGTVTTANPATYNVETDNFTLTNPTKAGYTFAGWTGTGLTDPTLTVTIPKGSLGDRTYTATWTITTYNITYDLAGGTVATANPTSYTVETNDFTLNNPTRSGYDFQGWHGTGVDVVSTTVTVAKGSTGNRTYTAHWVVSGSGVSDNWSGNAAASFSNISSTTINITSEAELALLAMNVNSGTNYSGYTVNLTTDLDLRGYYWVPIGNDKSGENNYFKGTFNGQGHTISGVIISTGNFQGLFGYIGEGGKVEGVKLTDSNISGDGNIGGIAGACDGTIENCHVAADVTLKATNNNIGGIAGYNDGTVAYCTSAATISSASETSYKGGVIGGAVTTATIVNNCLYYGDGLSALDGSITGQKVDNSGVTNCYHTTTQKGNGGTSEEGCKFVRVYDADPGIMGTVTKEYSNTTGYKVYEKGVSYGGKFYTAVVALTEDGITDLAAYAGQTIDVAFKRSFTKDVASTVCLPFAIDATQAAAAGKFYTFAGVDKTGSEWEVIMQEADTSVEPHVAGNEAASLAANTPYLFMPAATGPVLFYGELSATVSAGVTSDTEGWTFHGTYEKRQWDDTHNKDEIGRIYGFAAQDATSGSHNIEAGNFIRIAGGSNSYALPFRAYLKYEPAQQNAPRRTASELPATMKVRLVSNIGGTTAVTEMRNKELGKRNDGWFTLDGRKLDGKPSAKGVYINNGRKIVIK